MEKMPYRDGEVLVDMKADVVGAAAVTTTSDWRQALRR